MFLNKIDVPYCLKNTTRQSIYQSHLLRKGNHPQDGLLEHRTSRNTETLGTQFFFPYFSSSVISAVFKQNRRTLALQQGSQLFQFSPALRSSWISRDEEGSDRSFPLPTYIGRSKGLCSQAQALSRVTESKSTIYEYVTLAIHFVYVSNLRHILAIYATPQSNPLNTGAFSCNMNSCKTCPFITEGTTSYIFFSTTNSDAPDNARTHLLFIFFRISFT